MSTPALNSAMTSRTPCTIYRPLPPGEIGILGMEVDTVGTTLAQLVEGKRVVEAQGKYALAPAARMALESDYSRFYEEARANSSFREG